MSIESSHSYTEIPKHAGKTINKRRFESYTEVSYDWEAWMSKRAYLDREVPPYEGNCRACLRIGVLNVGFCLECRHLYLEFFGEVP